MHDGWMHVDRCMDGWMHACMYVWMDGKATNEINIFHLT